MVDKEIAEIILAAEEDLDFYKGQYNQIREEFRKLLLPVLYSKRISPPSPEHLARFKLVLKEIKDKSREWKESLGELQEVGG